ncbi:MAG: hypothetical protein CSA38_04030 [Flavobacteriales bacterium]|nr:MAG: hypothetical protein CSA38_04030 [Flavobacteriales bacterium]
MNTKFFKNTLIALSLMTATIANAQDHHHRDCLDKHYEALQNNPEYAASFYARKAKFEQKLKEIQQQKMNGTYQQRTSTLYIPVAVHFPNGSESNRACLEAFAQTQIDVINQDYTATNPDISNWAAASQYYPGLQPGSVNVKFCIATKNHPAGGDPEVLEGNPLVTIGSNGSNFPANFPEYDATYAGYMNFIIKDIGSSTLGYSPLIGDVAAGGAVVMNTYCYGTGNGCGVYSPQAPYNLGRTVTHELGHFYNLNHTFAGGCFGDGDAVDDTPPVAGPTYGNPPNGSVSSCNIPGQYALTMNYMDYVNDASMYMFTPGQMTRVEAYFATVEDEWKQDVVECNNDMAVTEVKSKFESIEVFPNPVVDNVNIKLKSNKDVDIKIYDATGNLVFAEWYKNNDTVFKKSINLDRLSSGMYFLHIETDTEMALEKILVK